MEQLNCIHQALLKYNYPNIYSLSEKEVSENVLAAPNRVFLLSWIIKVVSEEDYDAIVSEEDIVDFLLNLGICLGSEASKFVSGELGNLKEQTIICKLFTCVDNLKLDNDANSIDNEVPIHELSDLVEKDMNLFPCFGPIKQLSSKHADMVKNASELSRGIENSIKNGEQYHQICKVTKDGIANLKIMVLSQTNKIASIIRYMSGLECKLKCKDLILEKLKKCNKNLHEIFELLDNQLTIAVFNREFNKPENNLEINDDYLEMALEVAEHAHSIADELHTLADTMQKMI